jgi:hypothetical protein
MIKHIPESICNRIYDILVNHTGAPEQYRSAFLHYYAEPSNPTKPTEFRCCSKWGMAGKFWWNNERFYVSGRSRSECIDERQLDMEQTECDYVNLLLAPLHEEMCVGVLFESRHVQNAFHKIPELEQYQGSLYDQLQMLTRVANRLGLQDAATFIQDKIDHK